MNKALKALKELVYGKEYIKGSDVEERLYHIVETALKALEVIKEKPQIEITHIQWGKIKTYDEYLKRTYEWDLEYGDMVLTEEEFNLLKEMLCDEKEN